MTREQLVRIAREECVLHGQAFSGLVSITVGCGWLIVSHATADWLVVLQ